MRNAQENKVPVMLLFFNRPDTLQQVFDAIKKYEPKELFLVQDGARNGRIDDIENVEKCRRIVENVDWDCVVRHNYAEENMSCDHREYTGIDWCFKYVDRLIILEDDCVPTQSFMRLCEDCLEKYKNDTRIHSIYGFNRVGSYDCPYDYVFSMTSAGLGWATWKRVWNMVDQNRDLSCLENDTSVKYLKNKIDKNIKALYGDFSVYMQQTKSMNEITDKITSWEKLVGFQIIANNMLTIVPKKNMIRYIGITENATHSANDPRIIPHKTRNVLTQKAYEMEMGIKHPPFVIRDTEFEKMSIKKMKYLPGIARIESIFLKVRYFGIAKVWKSWREREKRG